MTDQKPTKKAAAKKAPAKRAARSGDPSKAAQAKAALAAAPEAPETPQPKDPQRMLSREDFEFDTGQILRHMGVDPGSVKEGSIRLTFPQGVPIIEYEVVRAVPPRILGMAFLAGSSPQKDKQTGESGEQD